MHGFENEGFEEGIFLFLATPLLTACRGRGRQGFFIL